MIASKRHLLIVGSIFIYLSCLFVAKRSSHVDFNDKLREELPGWKKSQNLGDSTKIAKKEAIWNKMRGVLKPVRRNKHWEKSRNLSANFSANKVKNTKAFPRKKYPLPPENALLNVAWFSLRTFWHGRHYPRLFNCIKQGKVIVSNAELDPDGIRQADVVLFAGGFEDEALWERLRAERDPGQLWLLNTDESPFTAKTHIPPIHMRDITFNITFTYRSNADISSPYGYFVANATKARKLAQKVNYHEKSPKLAAWMSSHCDTIAWNRTGFVWDLSQFLTIDKYGLCGNMTCGNATKYWERVVNNWCKRILGQYKFIFALENSCCTEYISEKFWHILRHYDAIPIVVGAPKEDYERLAPPRSFIYAADFESMEGLADYIKQVAADPTLYNSYFEWKEQGEVNVSHEKQRRIGYTAANCRILEYLQGSNITQGHHDLHGPAWLGGCSECGDKKILRNYRNSGYSYIQN
ncbi:Glycoprotein 3-alpha-L-fucosyltransferase A [Holothuria leucospilota]|uniref:Fucosyltransferase n=1 Tax=Holothuria leucospilota TaxID=206669 RepID=A0A9Q1BLH6_HOLLE|nr:Glycoprotein 3-alpha-L-fucosyltransferase A [Holothuria leucospilota]